MWVLHILWMAGGAISSFVGWLKSAFDPKMWADFFKLIIKIFLFVLLPFFLIWMYGGYVVCILGRISLEMSNFLTAFWTLLPKTYLALFFFTCYLLYRWIVHVLFKYVTWFK